MAHRGYVVDETTPIRFSFESEPRRVARNIARLQDMEGPVFGRRNVLWVQVSDDVCEIRTVNCRTVEEVQENISFNREGLSGLWYRTC